MAIPQIATHTHAYMYISRGPLRLIWYKKSVSMAFDLVFLARLSHPPFPRRWIRESGQWDNMYIQLTLAWGSSVVLLCLVGGGLLTLGQNIILGHFWSCGTINIIKSHINFIFKKIFYGYSTLKLLQMDTNNKILNSWNLIYHLY